MHSRAAPVLHRQIIVQPANDPTRLINKFIFVLKIEIVGK